MATLCFSLAQIHTHIFMAIIFKMCNMLCMEISALPFNMVC